MSDEEKKTFSLPFLSPQMNHLVSSEVGDLLQWEKERLSSLNEFKYTSDAQRKLTEENVALEIAESQLSHMRMRQWLEIVISFNGIWRERALVTVAALSFADNPHDEYVVDETSLVVRQLRERDETGLMYSSYCSSLDPDGYRAHRGAVRLLLSGSLMKNKDSVLHRSFFRSGLRETHLLPIIGSFLNRKGEVEEEEGDGYDSDSDSDMYSDGDSDEEEHLSYSERYEIHGIQQAAFHILRQQQQYPTKVDGYEFFPRFDNHLIGVLPLLSKICLLSSLYINSQSGISIDLSFMEEMDCPQLQILKFQGVRIPSLSPLSRCQLPFLRVLEIRDLSKSPHHLGFSSLEGLTKENAERLQTLTINNDDLSDISALSTCCLSSLCELELKSFSLSDMSPLQHCDLSAVVSLGLLDTAVSDLSPLQVFQDCILSSYDIHSRNNSLNLRGSAVSDLSPICSFRNLSNICLDNTCVEDLSPLSRCDMTHLVNLSCCNTKVSDLSPLSRCNNLTWVKSIRMRNCPISDLSPLKQCIGLSPIYLNFSLCPIKDLSPLSGISYQEYAMVTLDLNATLVEDISPLSGVVGRNVRALLANTPAANQIPSVAPGALHARMRQVGYVWVEWDRPSLDTAISRLGF